MAKHEEIQNNLETADKRHREDDITQIRLQQRRACIRTSIFGSENQSLN